jgi:hypothetical protein
MEKPINLIFLPLANEFVNELDEKQKKIIRFYKKNKERIIGQ